MNLARVPRLMVMLATGIPCAAGASWPTRAGANAEETAAPDRPPLRAFSGQVVDQAGKPVAGLLVFAADRRTDGIEAMAITDQQGKLQLALLPGPHNFGVFSATLAPLLVGSRGPAAFQLVVGPLRAPAGGAAGAPAVTFDAGGPRVIRGRVVDELGVGLRGVFIEALPGSGALKTATVSDARGTFALPVPGGPCHLVARAPGLKLMSSQLDRGRLLLVMTVAAEAQQLVVSDGRLLRFDLRDSIDPEYSPPAPVRAWLLQAYGICPNSSPLTARQRQALRKYWYLDVLRQPPPSPATISTADCTPAHLHEVLPPETVRVQGFVTWVETARAPE
jgi:hypothetical protein